MTEHGLGRIIRPDVRNLNYPLRAVVAPKKLPMTGSKYHYDNGWWGDQGRHPYCVGYACAHLLEDGPIPQRKAHPPIIDPVSIYKGAQELDEWEGNQYEGTSAGGACKWLQQKGIIKNYWWGFSLDDLLLALYEKPILFGESWYADMNNPNSDGFVTPTGAFEGGHQTLINGVDFGDKFVRVKNSWGRSKYTGTPTWGKEGHYYLTFENLNKLILDYGDIVYVEEVKDWYEKV